MVRAVLGGLLAVAVATAAGCTPEKEAPLNPREYAELMRDFRDARKAAMAGPTGWATLVNLCFLDSTVVRIGSDPANDCVLPRSAPARVGSIFLDGDTVVAFSAEPGVSIRPNGGRDTTFMRLRSPTDSFVPLAWVNSVNFFVLAYGGRLALRVRDSLATQRFAMPPISYFPVDTSWRVEARFEPYDPPKVLLVAWLFGSVERQFVPGTLVFEKQGRVWELDALAEPGTQKLFVMFSDSTGVDSTFTPGRYVYTDLPRAGRVWLDFNLSFTPPCAFTSLTACPLPPPRNTLPFRVRAGEVFTHPKARLPNATPDDAPEAPADARG
ncbi:MAG: DUF1684 domain-containing protein [Gemmatimonadales bacterium]|nr:DUF1684 domain-containing protein [Gemmatimonadales bacterium]